MGQDIQFNKQQALNKGLELVEQQNGTTEQIAHAKWLENSMDDSTEQSNLMWLQDTTMYARLPNTERLMPCGGGHILSITANTWGDIYGPLTEWLTLNKVPYNEHN